jgi:DnaJ-class molecular chaperone
MPKHLQTGEWVAAAEHLWIDCPECRGAGEVTIRHFSGDPQCETQETCPVCAGEGVVVDDEQEAE